MQIDQTINNYAPLKQWDRHFSNSPLGQILIAAAGGVLSFLIGKMLGG
jgi:hypothetical protein